jgi:hypothetical protein
MILAIETAAHAAEKQLDQMLSHYNCITLTMVDTEPVDLASIEPEDDIKF